MRNALMTLWNMKVLIMSEDIKICKNCGKQIKKIKTFDVWYHVDSDIMACFPDTVAEPKKQYCDKMVIYYSHYFLSQEDIIEYDKQFLESNDPNGKLALHCFLPLGHKGFHMAYVTGTNAHTIIWW